MGHSLPSTILESWRRKWQPTLVLLPGKFHGWRSLVGYSPRGRKESDTTERLHFLSFYSSFWRRKWQPTPVFFPGEFHEQRGLVDYGLWGLQRVGHNWATNTHTHSRVHRLWNEIKRGILRLTTSNEFLFLLITLAVFCFMNLDDNLFGVLIFWTLLYPLKIIFFSIIKMSFFPSVLTWTLK